MPLSENSKISTPFSFRILIVQRSQPPTKEKTRQREQGRQIHPASPQLYLSFVCKPEKAKKENSTKSSLNELQPETIEDGNLFFFFFGRREVTGDEEGMGIEKEAHGIE